MKAKELRELSSEDLKKQVQDLSRELYNLKNQLKVEKKEVKLHLLREKKKIRARALTVLREKELASHE